MQSLHFLPIPAILALLLGACSMLDPLADTPGVIQVSVSEAKALHERDVAFVDLRGYEYIEGHIPGALHLDWNENFDRENLARAAGENEEVVLYCYGHGCYRSRKASSLAASWGYNRVYHFAGGYRAWTGQNFPVE